jgi:hypothetical protein
VLLQCFVLDVRWSRSAKLQLQRLQFLRLLLGVDGGRAPLLGEFLVCYCPAIFDSLLVAAAAPFNPLTLRLGALEVTSAIMAAVCDHAGVTSLKSFKYRAVATADTAATDRILKCKVAVQRGISSILSMLDDSSDEVRVQALAGLDASASLILTDSEAVENAASSRGAKSDTLATAVLSSYTAVVNALLTQAAISTSSSNSSSGSSSSGAGNIGEQFDDHLDNSLRVVAVLDPALFEQRVRAVMADMMDEAVVQRLSGLVSHVDILLQLSKE